jgi:hypothetical protein
MPSSLLADARRHAAQVGLNLFGVVDAARFDACQPKDQRIATRWPRVGTVIVLGSGGREFWQRFAEACARRAGVGSLPAPQQFAGQCVREVATVLQQSQLPVAVLEPEGRCPSFARLAEAAGFGTVSPVSGMLLHPVFGPWVSLRAALLVEGHPFGRIEDQSITDRFQPCCSCRQPCLQACPAPAIENGAPAHTNGVPAVPCTASSQAGPCAATKCRCACPIGSEHRDGVGADTPSAAGVRPGFRLLRIGFGMIRFVPRFLRR